MKINIKQNYGEFLDHIHFPSFIYYYETNRILGMNQLARDILGDNIRNIKDVFNFRPKYSKRILSNGSLILYKQQVNSASGNIEIDMEVNVIELDIKHMCIVFFEQTYKQNFSKHLMSEVPRIYWKNKDQVYLGMNQSFKNDFHITLSNEELQNQNFKSINFTHIEVEPIVDVEEMRVIKAREFLYDILQLVKTYSDENVFITNNRIPFFNKNGTVLGLLGVYHLVLDNVNYNKQYQIALKDTYEMYEKQVELNLFFSDLLRIIQSDKEYMQIMEIIFDTIVKRYNFDHINIYKYDMNEKKIDCIYAWNVKKKMKNIENMDTNLRDMRNIVFRELRKTEYLVINSGEEQKKFEKLLKYNNMKALLLFRLAIRGNDKVLISFGDSKDREWTSEIITLLRDVTQLVQIVLEKYSLEQEIKELESKRIEGIKQ